VRQIFPELRSLEKKLQGWELLILKTSRGSIEVQSKLIKKSLVKYLGVEYLSIII